MEGTFARAVPRTLSSRTGFGGSAAFVARREGGQKAPHAKR